MHNYADFSGYRFVWRSVVNSGLMWSWLWPRRQCVAGHLSCWNWSPLLPSPLSLFLSFPIATAAAGFLAYRWSVKTRFWLTADLSPPSFSYRPAAPQCSVGPDCMGLMLAWSNICRRVCMEAYRLYVWHCDRHEAHADRHPHPIRSKPFVSATETLRSRCADTGYSE